MATLKRAYTRKIIIISICFFAFSNMCFSQKPFTKKEAFFYFMKAYNHTPDEKLGLRLVDIICSSYEEYYLKEFDNDNYIIKSKNEFEFNKYWASKKEEMNNGILTVDVKRTFVVKTNLGEYSFEKQSFPCGSSTYYLKKNGYFSFPAGLKIEINYIDNIGDFTSDFSMPKDKAELFIKNRTDSKGNINRTVYEKLTFSILPTPSPKSTEYFPGALGKSTLQAHIHSIEIYSDINLTKKLFLF